MTGLSPNQTLIDSLLEEQRSLTAVERFARWHEDYSAPGEPAYRRLLPATTPASGQQYAFEVDLDKCSGCKACVTACHSLNGLEENETWRSVGLLVSDPRNTDHAPRAAFQQHITTACHHCADPGCANGCPVLAYDKDPVTGIVRHLDDQCMGCSYCVMKCPYEVPKYSQRLGIVRKCDLCSQRLAVGEAPACVQACPNEAIRITLVDTQSPIRPRPAVIESFLPDSPDPRITLPTTRFLSSRLPQDLVAADHAVPRLDHPHWPLVIMLVLTQAAAGMFLTVGIGQLAGGTASVRPVLLVAFAMLCAGLAASVFHLGQPLKAWRAFLGWRKSWLSREIIAFNVFAGAASLAIFQPPTAIFAAAVGILAVFTSAMVYVDTQRPFWAARFTFINFLGTTLLLGAAAAAAVFGVLGQFIMAQSLAIAALVSHVGLVGWRGLELRYAKRHPSISTHLNARAIHEQLHWTARVCVVLFALSVGAGLLAITGVSGLTPVWLITAAMTAVASELICRYVFFAASASKRMPGGTAA